MTTIQELETAVAKQRDQELTTMKNHLDTLSQQDAERNPLIARIGVFLRRE